MAGSPYMNWFVDDYLADEKLQLCSMAARGLWMHLLCLMHKNDRRGYLQQANRQPYSYEQIARSAGCSTDEAAHLMQELLSSGVPSVSEHGVIYNRRMVREEELRKTRSEAGRKGGQARAAQFCLGKTVGKPSSKPSSKTQADAGPGNGKGEDGFSSGDEEGLGEEGGCALAQKDSARLAQLFAFLSRNTVKAERDPYQLEPAFAEWMRAGICTAEELQLEIERKDRDKSEPSWRMKDRLEKQHGSRPGPANASRPHGSRSRAGARFAGDV